MKKVAQKTFAGVINVNGIGMPFIDIQDPKMQEEFKEYFSGKSGKKVILSVTTEDDILLEDGKTEKLESKLWEKPSTDIILKEDKK